MHIKYIYINEKDKTYTISNYQRYNEFDLNVIKEFEGLRRDIIVKVNELNKDKYEFVAYDIFLKENKI